MFAHTSEKTSFASGSNDRSPANFPAVLYFGPIIQKPVNVDALKALVRTVKDFPKPGILFYDITTLLKDKTGFAQLVDRWPRITWPSRSTWCWESRPADSSLGRRWPTA